MKRISLMEFRRNLGEFLDQVRYTSEPIILERSGREIALVCPIGYKEEIGTELQCRKRALQQITGEGRQNPRSENPSQWLEHIRRGS